MSQKKEQQPNAIYELWDIALQHRWRFVLPAFLVTALVLGVCLVLPRKYKATANFERRNDPVLTEITNSGAVSSYMDPTHSLMKEIANGPAVAAAVGRLEPELRGRGYLDSETDLADLRQTVMQQLVVQREYADTQRVQVRLELVLDDPDVAALVVNTLVEDYMHKTRAEHAQRLESMAQTFRSHVEVHRLKQQELQDALGVYEEEYAELLPEHPHSIQSQLSQAMEELDGLQTEMEGTELRVASLREAIEAEPETLASIVHGRNPELERLKEKLRGVEEEIGRHLNVLRMRETHPEVVALREQARQVQEEIAALDTEVVTATQHQPNPKRGNLEVQLTSVLADGDMLREQISLRRRRIDELSAAAAQLLPIRSEYRRLETQEASALRDVTFYEDQLRRVEMSQTAESGHSGVQLTIIRRAEAAGRPVSPNLAQAFLAALFLGGACGALSVFFAHRTDDSFRNAGQLGDAMSLPMLGSVSELITRSHRRARTTRRYLLYPVYATAMAGILLAVGGVLYLDLENPDTLDRIRQKTSSWVAGLRPDTRPIISEQLNTDGSDDGLHF